MSACSRLLLWYQENKRDLPWRKTCEPYRIWLSEIMLQQTRVETVKEYYKRFLERFPDVEQLAQADEEEVLKYWEGLGYYSRARNLHKAAKIIAEQYHGSFPEQYNELLKLPGIGTYTAGAIASFAFDIPCPAIDGNVTRVAARFFGIGKDIALPDTQKQITQAVVDFQSKDQPGLFNQAIMELGATLCKPVQPCCEDCPLMRDCCAFHNEETELLPIHEKKKKPRAINMGVSLLEYDGKVLLMKRRERLLGGLYVFYLTEGETAEKHVRELLLEEGLKPKKGRVLGGATHVFTHRIWNMTILSYALALSPSEDWLKEHEAILADRKTILSLPLPTAMKAASTFALQRLSME